MTSAIVQGLVRHFITAVGGAFLLKYGLDGAGIDAVAGAIATIAGALWSVRDKVKAGA
jgi:1,4-alpha-glucan branching enzyme